MLANEILTVNTGLGRRLEGAALAEDRRELHGRLLNFLHGLFSFDVRTPGLAIGTLNGRGDGGDLFDRFFCVTVGTFRVGGIEAHRLLFFEGFPASFAYVFIHGHCDGLQMNVFTHYRAWADFNPADRLDTGRDRWVLFAVPSN